MGIVYVLYCNKNGKQYVGQTIQRLGDRFNQHKCTARTGDELLYRAIRKYGWDNFSYDIFWRGECTQVELNEWEKYGIKLLSSHKSTGRGYNVDWGGSKGKKRDKETSARAGAKRRGSKHSAESIARMRVSNKLAGACPIKRANLSAARRRRPPPSPETRKKMSESLIGKNKGKKRTPEARARMSAAAKKRGPHGPCSESARNNMSKAQKGRVFTDEHRERLRQAWVLRRQRAVTVCVGLASMWHKSKGP